MLRFKKLSKRTMELVVISALFPLWGIGSVQLFARSLNELAAFDSQSIDGSVRSLVSTMFSLSFMLFGLGMTLRTVWLQQAEKIPRLDAVQRHLLNGLDSEGIYDFDQEYDSLPRLHSRALDNLSYTRVWYLSFQNHLLAKSGIDTVKLTPLKRWPAILKEQMSEDLVPVWNLPLLLIVCAGLPALAIFIAALDTVFRAVTGSSFCAGCSDFVGAIAGCITFILLRFTWLVAVMVTITMALWVVPRMHKMLLEFKGARQELEAKRSELLMSSLGDETIMPGSYAQTRTLATEP
jgi:hypothetical protein